MATLRDGKHPACCTESKAIKGIGSLVLPRGNENIPAVTDQPGSNWQGWRPKRESSARPSAPGRRTDSHDDDGVAGTAPLGIGGGRHGLILDAALVGAAADAEVALLGPVRVPGVRDLPVLLAVLDTPAHDLHGVPADLLAGHVGVDAAGVVLEVGEDAESHLHGPAGHDGLLDAPLAAGLHDVALEVVLVRGEVVVGSHRVGVALLWAGRRGLRRAPRLPLGRVRVGALRPVVMAVREGEVAAEALAEGARALVLPAAHGALAAEEAALLHVAPRRRDLATAAAWGHQPAAVEADVLGRQRHHLRPIRSDAHAVGGRLRTGKGPAAAAIRLVADVSDDLRAMRPLLRGVEVVGNGGVGVRRAIHDDLALGNEVRDGLALIANDTHHVLGHARSPRGKPRVGSGPPEHTRSVLNLLDLCGTLRVHILSKRRPRNGGQSTGGKDCLHGKPTVEEVLHYDVLSL